MKIRIKDFNGLNYNEYPFKAGDVFEAICSNTISCMYGFYVPGTSSAFELRSDQVEVIEDPILAPPGATPNNIKPFGLSFKELFGQEIKTIEFK